MGSEFELSVDNAPVHAHFVQAHFGSVVLFHKFVSLVTEVRHIKSPSMYISKLSVFEMLFNAELGGCFGLTGACGGTKF